MAIDFPSTPTLGQIFKGGELFYQCVAVGPPPIWDIIGSTSNRMSFIDYVLTTGGTWVKPAGLTKLEITLVGGGGGSGGAAATTAGQSAAGGGGGGGGAIKAIYHDVSILTSHAYVIGAGGTSVGGVGGNGGSTTFKLLTASGGTGIGVGAAQAGLNITTAQAGGVGSSTEPTSCVVELFAGGKGGGGITSAHGVLSCAVGGEGGSSLLAPRGVTRLIGGGLLVGDAGIFPGGGACGTANSVSQTLSGSQVGGAGVIYMREWY